MRQLVLLAGVLALSTAADADDKKTAAPKAAILIAASDIQWTPDPKRPGTYTAPAEGNPDKGPAHFYLKYDKGFAGGLHHHSHDHGGWILQGTVILVVDGVETKLPPGSFYFVKAKKPHLAKCDAAADCVMTVDVRGKWDAISDAPKK